MSLSDPIANMLTVVRNAVDSRKESVDIPASKLTQKIMGIMKDSGYIEDFRLLKDDKQGIVKVYLKYRSNKKPAIMGLKRVSRPGLKVYVKNDKIPRVLSGLGIAVISTSKGLVSDKEARKLKIGGELICYIW